MKKMFVVNGEEFKVGNVYSRTDAKKFKKADDFKDAIYELTTKKHDIVLVEEVLEGKNVKLKIVEELDYKKIFNSNDILPHTKLDYLFKMNDTVRWQELQPILEEGRRFTDNYMDDLYFSLAVVGSRDSIFKKDTYLKHLNNLIDKDTTGEYLRHITRIRYSSNENYYSKKIVEKMLEQK